MSCAAGQGSADVRAPSAKHCSSLRSQDLKTGPWTADRAEGVRVLMVSTVRSLTPPGMWRHPHFELLVC